MQAQRRWSRIVWISCQGLWLGMLAFSPLTSQAQTIRDATLPLLAQRPIESEQADQEAVLTVGIGGTPPFLIREEDEDDNYQGLVLDLWKQIALINDYDYELVLQTNTQVALDAVASGELDLLAG